MSQQPQQQPKGRGRGRGRGRGTQVPLAAQLRQLDREIGPEEPRLLKRFAPLGAIRVRSEYGTSGLLYRSLGRPSKDGSKIEWIDLPDAELLLAQHHRDLERSRLVARIATRLPGKPADLEKLSQEDIRILRMSNSEFIRFQAGTGVPAGGSQRSGSQASA